MDLISSLVSVVAGVCYISIEVSCLLGYFIVRNATAIFSIIFQATAAFFRMLHVLFEDYCIFMSDLIAALCYVGQTVQLCVESAYHSPYYFSLLINTLWACISPVVNVLVGCVASVYNLFHYVFSSIINVYILFCNTGLFAGLTVWNVVTGVPDFICFLMYACLLGIKELAKPVNYFVYKHLLRPIYEPHLFFSSLCDHMKSSVLGFPLKPLCGLSMGIFFIFIMFKKRNSLLNFIYGTWLLVTTRSQQVVVSAWQTFEGYVLWLLTNQRRDWQRVPLHDRFNDNIDGRRFLNDIETDSVSDSDASEPTSQSTSRRKRTKHQDKEDVDEDIDVRLCVVCQDKTRCMLTLPCRHVCLCTHCCAAVKAQQGLCPLCRQEISFAGKVYL